MDIRLRVSLIIAILIYFLSIFFLLREKKLALKYTLLWIFGGFLMVVVVAFPKVFMCIMNMFGIVEPVNGVFAAVIFLLILLLISITSILSQMNDKIRAMAQKVSLYEKRIRDLEEKSEDE